MSAKKQISKQPSVVIPPIEKTSAGKGKKHCPSCDGIIAARTTTCPLCGFVIPPKEKDGEPKTRKTRTPKTSQIDQNAFIKVLAQRGFKFTRLRNELTGELVKEETDPKIEALNLKYSTIPANAEKGIYVTSTSPQIQFAMNLDTFLEVAKLKP